MQKTISEQVEWFTMSEARSAESNGGKDSKWVEPDFRQNNGLVSTNKKAIRLAN